MRRVLMIGQMSIVGGQQSFMMNYFRHIDKTRFHVDFLGVHGNTSPYQEEIERNGGTLYYWNKTFGFSELISSLIALVKFIKKGNYDVVHSNIYLGNCWFIVAAFLAGVKIRISHSHCTFPLANETDGKFMRFYHSVIQKHLLLTTATHYFACGQEAGKALYGKNKFVVMRNGIDIDNYFGLPQECVNAIKTEFSIKETTRVYASISRFDANKNLLYVLRLFNNIHREIPDSVLIVGGAEPYDDSTHQEIEDYVKKEKLTECIHIVGTRSDLPTIMQVVDCWLFPSLHEGLPIVGIELQAASVNIIASDTITKEMDMGLGLVKYLPLDDEESWYISSLGSVRRQLPKDKISHALVVKGYGIKECVKELEDYYLGHA